MSHPLFLSMSVKKVHHLDSFILDEQLAMEEPLEIQVAFGEGSQRHLTNIGVTMRTPGHDTELAVGYLISEGLLRNPSDLLQVCAMKSRVGHQAEILLSTTIEADVDHALRRYALQNHLGANLKSSMQVLDLQQFRPVPSSPWQMDCDLVCDLPRRLQQAQEMMDCPTGVHAAGLFRVDGTERVIRQDVGRHNAIDKVVGHCFLNGTWPLHDSVMVVSGRASFDLVQRAIAASIPVLVAVGAPSSLAVEVAQQYGVTLIGLTKSDGCNIYAGEDRLSMPIGKPRIDLFEEALV